LQLDADALTFFDAASGISIMRGAAT
jgi:hypothetical protein